MWYVLALSSAVLYAFRGILEKKIIHNTNKYILGLAIRLFALPFFFIPLILNPTSIIPLSHLNINFWIAIIYVCFISTPFETIFYYEALKDEDVSLVIPILSLTPVLTVLFSLFILKEVPNLFGFIGVFSLVFGIYALKIGSAKEGLLQPLHHLRNNRGVRLMSLVMISLALQTGSAGYVIAIRNASIVFTMLFSYLFLREKEIKEKIFAALFIFIGLVLIKVSS